MPEQAKVPEYLGKCEVLKIHDDGDLTIRCEGKKHIVTTEGEVFREFKGIVGKPPRRLTIEDVKHKLVGVEKSEATAEIWATNMREHSGEKIEILTSDEGYALYREE